MDHWFNPAWLVYVLRKMSPWTENYRYMENMATWEAVIFKDYS